MELEPNPSFSVSRRGANGSHSRFEQAYERTCVYSLKLLTCSNSRFTFFAARCFSGGLLAGSVQSRGHSNGMPVCLEMARRSSTIGMMSGTPFLRRSRSAIRSGSPGINGPLVPGAGLVARKVRT